VNHSKIGEERLDSIIASNTTPTMASTTPSQSTSLTTILLASTGVIVSASLAYALYFDHKRRSDPDFRKNLKKQQKKISRQNEEASKAAERSQKDKIRRVVDEANEEGFPKDPEETESYFMQEVARGEGMCQDGSDPVEAALCFYRALKVYPQPRELISIYDKTVPKVRLRCDGWIGRWLISLTAHPRYSCRDDCSRPEYICHRLWSWLGRRFRQG
jgi:import receptor subunit TOM20